MTNSDTETTISISHARAFIYEVMSSIWAVYSSQRSDTSPQPLRELFSEIETLPGLSESERLEAQAQADKMVCMPLIEASFLIGELYTKKLPKEYRARYGIYFTPPALTSRLLDSLEENGIDWLRVSAIDPACGGGAFLSPMAARMKASMHHEGIGDAQIIESISGRLRGKEIDPFSGWLSQVFFELSLIEEISATGRTVPVIVEICDTLRSESEAKYDLVIGNPPYSKIKLDKEMRARYERSLYGHANLYGLFTDKAFSMLSENGILAFVTPTSFLSGQYFKNLRNMISSEGNILSIDFVEARKGVFDSVLQETLLAVFTKDPIDTNKSVSSTVHVRPGNKYDVEVNGLFSIPPNSSDPWFIPRNSEHEEVLTKAQASHSKLEDYGYKVSTGPLVWNRHKELLSSKKTKHTLPLIWSESVLNDGSFKHRAEKKNHVPWITIKEEKDNWLVVNDPCLALQRTTAKEQQSRLICAVIPEDFINQYGGVVIENHLNMIKPIHGRKQLVDLEVLKRILKSRTADLLFRVMNGSVAVSAYELEALLLPPVSRIKNIVEAVKNGFSEETIEKIIRESYDPKITKAA
jgi:adenine-specific DNA-methyltransferase